MSVRDNHDRTPLHCAICSGCPAKVLEAFLENGRADIFNDKRIPSSKGGSTKEGSRPTISLHPWFSYKSIYDCSTGNIVAFIDASNKDASEYLRGHEITARSESLNQYRDSVRLEDTVYSTMNSTMKVQGTREITNAKYNGKLSSVVDYEVSVTGVSTW